MLFLYYNNLKKIVYKSYFKKIDFYEKRLDNFKATNFMNKKIMKLIIIHLICNKIKHDYYKTLFQNSTI